MTRREELEARATDYVRLFVRSAADDCVTEVV